VNFKVMDKATAAAIATLTIGAMSAQAGHTHKGGVHEEVIEGVSKGMSAAEVIRVKGKPNQKSSVNGHEQWIYIHTSLSSMVLSQFSVSSGQDVLSVTFNRGCVENIEHDR
jgi:hypothetical protein